MHLYTRETPGAASLNLSHVRNLMAGAAAAAVFAFASPANALVITPVYDSTVTSSPYAQAIQSAFASVASQFQYAFSNPVTLKIGVSFGYIATNRPLPAGDIAASLEPISTYYSYSLVSGYLAAAAAANPTDSVLASAVRSLPTLNPTNSLNGYAIPYGEAQALHIFPAVMRLASGYVGFASSVNWDFNPVDGITAGSYDFQGLVAHEISEVMGRITGLTSATPGFATPFDAMRYTAPGVSSFSFNTPAYFSIDGGKTNLGVFNSGGGGDRSDWAGIAGDVSNAYLNTGTLYTLSSADWNILDALGWGTFRQPPTSYGEIGANVDPNALAFGDAPSVLSFGGGPSDVPEPATWAMMLVGFGLAGGALRRRGSARAQ